VRTTSVHSRDKLNPTRPIRHLTLPRVRRLACALTASIIAFYVGFYTGIVLEWSDLFEVLFCIEHLITFCHAPKRHAQAKTSGHAQRPCTEAMHRGHAHGVARKCMQTSPEAMHRPCTGHAQTPLPRPSQGQCAQGVCTGGMRRGHAQPRKLK